MLCGAGGKLVWGTADLSMFEVCWTFKGAAATAEKKNRIRASLKRTP